MIYIVIGLVWPPGETIPRPAPPPNLRQAVLECIQARCIDCPLILQILYQYSVDHPI